MFWDRIQEANFKSIITRNILDIDSASPVDQNRLPSRQSRAAPGILVSQPGFEPVPPVLGAQSLEHWTPREVCGSDTLISWI